MQEFIDKLIGRLEELQGVFIASNCVNKADAVCESIRIAKELAEQHNNGWINCSSDNMPSNGQEVYVEFKDGQHMCLIYRTEDSRKKSDGWEMNITQDGFYEICSDYGWKPYRNIVAWHPLPPAYKEGGV